MKFIKFQLGDRFFALPLELAGEILPMATLMKPPGLFPLLEGFLNLGGIAIAVLRLDRALGLPMVEPTPDSHLLIVKPGKNELSYALLVDHVLETFESSEEQMITLPHQIFKSCVEQELTHRSQVVHLLSLKNVLLEQERSAVGALQLSTQKKMLELLKAVS
ncbi:MAG: chemotaxis protein CheW [Proteobacteria bacterium]|nr:MAG: chemotaxis protein CheW [Pseudomonadota bacterium]